MISIVLPRKIAANSLEADQETSSMELLRIRESVGR